MARNEIAYERLRDVLDYDANTGLFTWKKTVSNVRVGSVAGCMNNGNGYISIGIDKKIYYAHRLAWLYIYGYLPEHGIDHIDRNKKNNKINNLREANQSCNMRNTGNQKNNTSGVKGVNLSSSKNKWRSRVKINKKEICIGIFENFNDAVKARWEAEKKYGFPDCCTGSSAYIYLKENGLI